MSIPKIFTETPYGFNVIELGSLTVYCGKVRIKGIQFTPDRAYINVHYKGPYCIISFEVTDKRLANDLYRVLGTLCREVAQSRLNEKWKWLDTNNY